MRLQPPYGSYPPLRQAQDEGRMTVKRKAFHPLTPAQAGVSCSSTKIPALMFASKQLAGMSGEGNGRNRYSISITMEHRGRKAEAVTISLSCHSRGLLRFKSIHRIDLSAMPTIFEALKKPNPWRCSAKLLSGQSVSDHPKRKTFDELVFHRSDVAMLVHTPFILGATLRQTE